MKKWLITYCLVATTHLLMAQQPPAANYHANSRFEQMGTAMPTPNTYRTASGAPGKEYWQNRVDYDIKVEINDEKQHLSGSETVTYFNNSPDELRYIWMQLDQNLFQKNSMSSQTRSSSVNEKGMPMSSVMRTMIDKDYGHKITLVKDQKTGQPLRYTINETMMRIEVPTPLRTGQSFSFQIDWNYNITDFRYAQGRSGAEFFQKDGNFIYEIAQWFPRACVYDDVNGWQNKQFLGQGEFTLAFGNYKVAITVPNDHLVGASGELQNANQVLSAEQLKRLEKARTTFDKPVLIVNQEEATKNEANKPSGKKTWIFKADNVRDFAFATSRKFIWDAMNVELNGKKIMAMSFYPKEANPLWGQYSTMLVAHTVKTYSKFTFDYPYPVAQSIHGPVGGMEYPMISFNGARPEADGTYSQGTKNFLIQVVIHEVGHNWFPMIVNSDERQWTWMDEGLNSFLEYLALIEWDPNFPADRGPAKNIVAYMSGDQKGLEPIMTNSESIRQFGNNAYGKPAAALNILRETVMGRELFDYGFKTYANRWKFKHPTPEDFFRTMEDATAFDLDWFWRGWFYTTDYNDIGIKEVKRYFVSNEPSKEVQDFLTKRRRRNANPGPMVYMIAENSVDYKKEMDKPFDIKEIKTLDEYVQSHFTKEEQQKLNNPKYFYQVTFDKPGGLVMPILVELTFDDGTTENYHFPAQIWRMNDVEATRTFATNKPVKKITIDPKEETADIDTSNNMWPKEQLKSKFD